MSRTPLVHTSNSSFVKLPDIDKGDKSRLMLENFGVKQRSYSKLKVHDNSRNAYGSPQKINNHKHLQRTIEKYKVYSPMKIKGKVILSKPKEEIFKNEEEEEKKDEVFRINTVHAKGERNTLKEVIKLEGFKETKATGEGNLLWYYSSLREIDLKILNYRQCLFNRYPRASTICRKRQFHILLKKYQRYFPDDFDFIPRTYCLPDEYKSFRKRLDRKDDAFFLAKPSKGKGGDGIFFINKGTSITKEDMRIHEYIAQEYIKNPLLIDNKKFDFRLYLLIKGVDTMKAYIAFEGMARFCTEEYSKPAKAKKDSAQDDALLYKHLTNYSLNKKNENYVCNNDFENNENEGSKRLLSTIFKYLENDGIDVDEIKEDIRDICSKIVLAMQPFLVNSFHTDMGVGMETNQNLFHIFGLDILLDEDYKSWVMEINCFPSLSYFFDKPVIDPETETEKSIKLVSDLDKYLKPIVVKEAISIVRSDEIPKDSVFEQVFPPQEYPEDYQEFTVYNDIRVLFEILAGFRKPDILTLSQFQKICYFPGMKTDKLGKPEYAIIFAQYAKRGNRSFMTLDNFGHALEHLCSILYPEAGMNPRPLVSKLLEHTQSKAYY
ncbi:unnamed protein product [Moneuplotes crassus]|uniref:Uncharacterized protein n=1 Tax=Euplotes crassus TaxID=5936 RepID=A0AAD1X9Y4_EUPCR|nr:unnamed protein product [Moneuplotes crassus]